MRPLIVGIGGTAIANSSTEQALKLTLSAAASCGARTQLFGSEFLSALPHYLTPATLHSSEGRELVASIRAADGVVIASPGYHGSISGLVKNAIDYLEETANDSRPYLDGMPVGLIATAYGWQATGSTLTTLRSIVHALRGWPTPLGATLNTTGGIFTGGQCTNAAAAKQLDLVGRQVTEFACMRAIDPKATLTGGG